MELIAMDYAFGSIFCFAVFGMGFSHAAVSTENAGVPRVLTLLSAHITSEATMLEIAEAMQRIGLPEPLRILKLTTRPRVMTLRVSPGARVNAGDLHAPVWIPA